MAASAKLKWRAVQRKPWRKHNYNREKKLRIHVSRETTETAYMDAEGRVSIGTLIRARGGSIRSCAG
jgi:hypothetical protein